MVLLWMLVLLLWCTIWILLDLLRSTVRGGWLLRRRSKCWRWTLHLSWYRCMLHRRSRGSLLCGDRRWSLHGWRRGLRKRIVRTGRRC